MEMESTSTIKSSQILFDKCLKIPEVAAILDIGERAVRTLIQRHELAAIRIGKYIRVLPEDLLAYQKKLQEQGYTNMYDKHVYSKKVAKYGR